MKIDKLRRRLKPDRPMTTISIRMPEDVIEDLRRIAPLPGFSGYQPLMRAYIGQGLRGDLEGLDKSPSVAALIKVLRQRGVDEKVLSSVVAESKLLRSA